MLTSSTVPVSTTTVIISGRLLQVTTADPMAEHLPIRIRAQGIVQCYVLTQHKHNLQGIPDIVEQQTLVLVSKRDFERVVESIHID